MAIMRYRPFRTWDPVSDFHNLADVFNDRFADMQPFFGGRRRDDLPLSWHPSVDMYESDDYVFVDVDLPGVTKDEIDISFDGHILSITGNRSLYGTEEGVCHWSRERFAGEFHRYVHIPADVMSENLKAKFDNGVLRLELPKVEKEKRRKIAIESGDK